MTTISFQVKVTGGKIFKDLDIIKIKLERTLDMGSSYKENVSHWYGFHVKDICISEPFINVQMVLCKKSVHTGFGPKGKAVKYIESDGMPTYSIKDLHSHVISSIKEMSKRGEWVYGSNIRLNVNPRSIQTKLRTLRGNKT